MRSCRRWRQRTSSTSSTAMAPKAPSATSSRRSASRPISPGSAPGGWCRAACSTATSRASQSAAPTTPSLSNVRSSSIQPSAPSSRRNPASGLTRDRSGSSASPRSEKPRLGEARQDRRRGHRPEHRQDALHRSPQQGERRLAARLRRLDQGAQRLQPGQPDRRQRDEAGERRRQQRGEAHRLPRQRHLALLAGPVQPARGRGFRAVLGVLAVLRHGSGQPRAAPGSRPARRRSQVPSSIGSSSATSSSPARICPGAATMKTCTCGASRASRPSANCPSTEASTSGAARRSASDRLSATACATAAAWPRQGCRRAHRQRRVAFGQGAQRQGIEAGRQHQHRRRQAEQPRQRGALGADRRVGLQRAGQADHQRHDLPRLGQGELDQPRQQAEPEADHGLQREQPQQSPAVRPAAAAGRAAPPAAPARSAPAARASRMVPGTSGAPRPGSSITAPPIRASTSTAWKARSGSASITGPRRPGRRCG